MAKDEPDSSPNSASGTWKPVLGLSDDPAGSSAPVDWREWVGKAVAGTVFAQPEPDPLIDLTVIIPARNEEDCLGACLQSLVSQSEDIFELGKDWELIVVNDNSTGNDQVICDKSITTVAQLKGKTIAAELGVVDQFLLLQGLAKEGMTQSDINFQGVKTDAAAAAFAGGQFDCVGVFAPFTLQALKRPNSHVLFSSKEFPGAIPDHIVVSQKMVAKNPKVAQKIQDIGHLTLPKDCTKNAATL